MISVSLTRIKTRDGITLEGMHVKPRRKGNVALIWLHGFGSNFAHGQTLIKELSSKCRTAGIGYFKFNTRGHDIASRGNKNKKLIGAGFEKFEDCIFDIRAMIQFARSLGYKKIILAGHSTGANKALYSIYKTQDHRVKGLILAGPVSDVSFGKKEYGTQKLKHGLTLAHRLVAKKSSVCMPLEFGFYSPSRFLSLFSAGIAEDVFPYHDPNAQWKELKSVRVPIAVIFGDRDEYRDRPVKKLIEIFRGNATSTKSFSKTIIKEANHSFHKKEKELAKTLINFIKRAIV